MPWWVSRISSLGILISRKPPDALHPGQPHQGRPIGIGRFQSWRGAQHGALSLAGLANLPLDHEPGFQQGGDGLCRELAAQGRESAEALVAGACQLHHHLQHRVRIGGAELGELLGREPQAVSERSRQAPTVSKVVRSV